MTMAEDVTVEGRGVAYRSRLQSVVLPAGQIVRRPLEVLLDSTTEPPVLLGVDARGKRDKSVHAVTHQSALNQRSRRVALRRRQVKTDELPSQLPWHQAMRKDHRDGQRDCGRGAADD